MATVTSVDVLTILFIVIVLLVSTKETTGFVSVVGLLNNRESYRKRLLLLRKNCIYHSSSRRRTQQWSRRYDDMCPRRKDNNSVILFTAQLENNEYVIQQDELLFSKDHHTLLTRRQRQQQQRVVVTKVPVQSSFSLLSSTVVDLEHDSSSESSSSISQQQQNNINSDWNYNKKYNWNKNKKILHHFFNAGTLDVYRISHSIIGLLSIGIGLYHMVEVLFWNSFTDTECTIGTILFCGFVHTTTGLFGVRRLNFNNKREAARNAMFWPAPIQSLWLSTVSLTEWGQGSDAVFSIWDSPYYTAFTVFNVLLTFWQLSEVLTKTGNSSRTKDTIWFQQSSHNAVLVEFSYLLWMQLQMGTVLYMTHHVSMEDFQSYMDTYPKMQSLLSNLALNTAFFNNLAIFLATMLRYKLISVSISIGDDDKNNNNNNNNSNNHNNIIVFALPLISSVYIVWKVLSCFFLQL